MQAERERERERGVEGEHERLRCPVVTDRSECVCVFVQYYSVLLFRKSNISFMKYYTFTGR